MAGAKTHKCDKEKEIAEIHTMVQDLHKIIKGNGKPGLWAEFNQAKGGFLVFKFVASSSLIISILTFIFSKI